MKCRWLFLHACRCFLQLIIRPQCVCSTSVLGCDMLNCGAWLGVSSFGLSNIYVITCRYNSTTLSSKNPKPSFSRRERARKRGREAGDKHVHDCIALLFISVVCCLCFLGSPVWKPRLDDCEDSNVVSAAVESLQSASKGY